MQNPNVVSLIGGSFDSTLEIQLVATISEYIQTTERRRFRPTHTFYGFVIEHSRRQQRQHRLSIDIIEGVDGHESRRALSSLPASKVRVYCKNREDRDRFRPGSPVVIRYGIDVGHPIPRPIPKEIQPYQAYRHP